MVISLLITHTSSEKTAAAEVLDILLPLDAEAKVITTHYEGVILVDTKIEPLQAFNAIIKGLPSVINKVVPLMAVVKASISEVKASSLKIMENYKSAKSFAVKATVRGSYLEDKDLENRLGAEIKNKLGLSVNLKNPEIIVFIEVVDDIVGISILPSSHPVFIKGLLRKIQK